MALEPWSSSDHHATGIANIWPQFSVMMSRTSIPRTSAGILAIFVLVLYVLRPRTEPTRKLEFLKSSFDWNAVGPFYDPSPLARPPSGVPQRLPPIQHRFPRHSRFWETTQANRRDIVKQTFSKSWKSYRALAWMKDELTPLTAASKNTLGGWAATLVDSLDTLWIMDLKEEFYEAVEAVAKIDWAVTDDTACNMFETTIRHLGGLLAAYELSQEPVLLAQAIELGDMLYCGFDTPTRMPVFWLDFDKAKRGDLLADSHAPAASAGSLSLEFTRLSQLTGDPKYYDAVSPVGEWLHRTQNDTKLPGMWPTFLNLREPDATHENSFTLGALADSLYEYLPKIHLLYRPMTVLNEDILFSGTVTVDRSIALDPEGQHLGCFAGGTFALAGRLFHRPDHVDVGAKLARGCAWAYQAFPTGIMPEIFGMVPCESLVGCEWDENRWRQELAIDPQGFPSLPRGFRNARDPAYVLRPEAIESVFLLYRITGLEEFRHMAWTMFQAIDAMTATPIGNVAIYDVTVAGPPVQRDSMESFWLAETLKYFYLIFSPPGVLSLDELVFNTEAHPLRIPTA